MLYLFIYAYLVNSGLYLIRYLVLQQTQQLFLCSIHPLNWSVNMCQLSKIYYIDTKCCT